MTGFSTPALRLGLIGPGMIAQKAIGPALQQASGIQLAAVASRSLDRAKAFAARFGGRVVPDYDGLITAPDLDCVYISLPNHLHAPWSLRALAAGKHVICDKPAVLSVGEAEQVAAACEKYGVRFFEAFMFRFHPQHRVVQEVIASGRVGEPFHIFATFGFPPLPAGDFRWSKQMGGGALFDAGVYPIAAARMLFGEVAHRVYASWILARVEGVDIRGSAQLDFSGGRTAHVAFGFDNFYKNSYAVWGSRGHILLGRAFTVPTNHATTVTVQAEGGTETLTVDPVDQFRLMLEAFAAGLRGHAEVGLGWEEEMLGQARVVDALRRSATDGTVAYV